MLPECYTYITSYSRIGEHREHGELENTVMFQVSAATTKLPECCNYIWVVENTRTQGTWRTGEAQLCYQSVAPS